MPLPSIKYFLFSKAQSDGKLTSCAQILQSALENSLWLCFLCQRRNIHGAAWGQSSSLLCRYIDIHHKNQSGLMWQHLFLFPLGKAEKLVLKSLPSAFPSDREQPVKKRELFLIYLGWGQFSEFRFCPQILLEACRENLDFGKLMLCETLHDGYIPFCKEWRLYFKQVPLGDFRAVPSCRITYCRGIEEVSCPLKTPLISEMVSCPIGSLSPVTLLLLSTRFSTRFGCCFKSFFQCFTFTLPQLLQVWYDMRYFLTPLQHSLQILMPLVIIL